MRKERQSFVESFCKFTVVPVHRTEMEPASPTQSARPEVDRWQERVLQGVYGIVYVHSQVWCSIEENTICRFGVCCIFVISTTGSTVTQNCSYVQNPGFPSALTAVTPLEFTINKCANSNSSNYIWQGLISKLTFKIHFRHMQH